MPYIYAIPSVPTFIGKGMLGYTFGPLRQNIDFYYIEVKSGHDFFMKSRKITRIYYVLAGLGYFIINNHKYEVGPSSLVEIPPKVEYCYTGQMTLLAFATPRWFRGNDVLIKWNPDVAQDDLGFPDEQSRWARIGQLRICGKSVIGAYLRLSQLVWNSLPSSFVARAQGQLPGVSSQVRNYLSASLGASAIGRAYGRHLHAVVNAHSRRSQSFGTYFLRNRPELQLMQHLLESKAVGSDLNVCVLGCSKGAEVYSILWAIRSVRPDLRLSMHAVDTSQEILEFAESGVYSLDDSNAGTVPDGDRTTGKKTTKWNTDRDQVSSIFERMTEEEKESMFDIEDGRARVKHWLKEGVSWLRGDAGDPQLANVLGQHDIVVANRFLCHMRPAAAERCLRNLAQLVKPGGHLFVSGVDLNIRSRVAQEMNWKPVTDLIREIHEGDTSLRNGWPLNYWALEPFCDSREDWRIRYASVFQLGATPNFESSPIHDRAQDSVGVVSPVSKRGSR